MIDLVITTRLTFNGPKELAEYCEVPEMWAFRQITLQALLTRKPVSFETLRPELGTVATSQAEVVEYEDDTRRLEVDESGRVTNVFPLHPNKVDA